MDKFLVRWKRESAQEKSPNSASGPAPAGAPGALGDPAPSSPSRLPRKDPKAESPCRRKRRRMLQQQQDQDDAPAEHPSPDKKAKTATPTKPSSVSPSKAPPPQTPAEAPPAMPSLLPTPDLPRTPLQTPSSSDPEAPRFRPLRPEALTEEERRAEEDRAVHKPLPVGVPKRDVHLARHRRVDFRVAYLRRDLPHVDVAFDRAAGEDEDEDEQVAKSLPKGFFKDAHYTILLSMMADLDSNCVVALGGDRLEESLAKKKLEEFEADRRRRELELKASA